MKALTIRNVDPRLARALERETAGRGTSLKETVLDLQCRALGVDPTTRRSNGLRALAGMWSARDLAEFEEHVALFAEVDPELWS